MKPYQEFTPHQQATQYFDGLRDIREEAIQFESAQRKVSFHDSIPRYKWDEGFLNYGKGQGCGVLSQKTKATDAPVDSASETTTGQFTDVNKEISESAPATVTMPALEDAGLLEGAAAPDPGTYEPAGNKFTRLHSPRMDDDNSDEPPSSSQETPDCSQQDNKKQTEEDNPPTLDFHPGTPYVIIAQLDQEQNEAEKAPAQ